MATTAKLGPNQRWWPDARRRGVLVRETRFRGCWLTDAEIARELGMNVKTLHKRFQRGGDIEQPLRPYRRGNDLCELMRAWR